VVDNILRKELDAFKSGATADQVWSSCLDLLKGFEATLQEKEQEGSSDLSSVEILLGRK